MKITSYSTALFSTWHYLHDIGVLLDCGDGVVSHLLQRSGAIRHVFISHADRDHVTGLHRLSELNPEGGLAIHYPAASGSFPALAEFLARFDPEVTGVTWNPIRPGDCVRVGTGLVVEAHANSHMPADKSLGYRLFEVRRKLRPEYMNLSGPEIMALGKEVATHEARVLRLAYSGDTPCENLDLYAGAQVLFHECTFLTEVELTDRGQVARHTSLDQLLPEVCKLELGALVLTHFSARYDADLVRTAVRDLCKKFSVCFPVHAVLPGEVARNVLSETPLWPPARSEPSAPR